MGKLYEIKKEYIYIYPAKGYLKNSVASAPHALDLNKKTHNFSKRML